MFFTTLSRSFPPACTLYGEAMGRGGYIYIYGMDMAWDRVYGCPWERWGRLAPRGETRTPSGVMKDPADALRHPTYVTRIVPYSTPGAPDPTCRVAPEQDHLADG